MTECEKRGCDNPAEKKVIYLEPSEKVAYCEACTTWALTHFDPKGVREL